MAIISFEHIAPDGETAEIPDGYRDFIWKNFVAADDEVKPNTGLDYAIHSGEASAFNGFAKPAGFKSPDSADDFDLNSGFFAAAYTNGLEVKVFGYDDGERVARKVFTLDQTQELVTFGRKFDDIDEVKFTARGGTDADPTDDNPPAHIFAVDDLFIDF